MASWELAPPPHPGTETERDRPGRAPVPRSTEEAKATSLFRAGSVLALVGTGLSLGVPIGLALAGARGRWTLFGANVTFVAFTGLLVLFGALLLLLGAAAFHRAFVRLRHVDRRFTWAAVLCLVGAFGFVVLLASSILIEADEASLFGCVQGSLGSLLSCLRSGSPLGAYTGTIGFWLGWLGGVGLVLGLVLAGRRAHRPALVSGGILYGVFLGVLLTVFVALGVPLPGVSLILAVTPVLAVAAPALVLFGVRQGLSPAIALAP